jgi:dipeptidase E
MNRLDARARLVFHYAREEADRLGHAVIESEHLLLGLLREGGIAAQVLNTTGLTLEAARHRVVELIGRFERSRDAPPPAITALARRVMDLAGVEAGRYQSSFITTGHVLLGMIHAGDGVAMGIINQVEGGTKTVRRQTLVALNLPPDPEEGSNTGLSGIVAVPADSVLGRLFQQRPEPETIALTSMPTDPEPIRHEPTDLEPTFLPTSVVAETQSQVVAEAQATGDAVAQTSGDTLVQALEVAETQTRLVEEPYIPPPPIRLTPEPTTPQEPISMPTEPTAHRQPMESKHPTPVIEAPLEPHIEKTPTLDLDVLAVMVQPTTETQHPAPTMLQPETDDDIPEMLLIDEAFVEVPLESESTTVEPEVEAMMQPLPDLDMPELEVSSLPVAEVSSLPVAEVSSLPVAEVSSLPVAEVSSLPVAEVSSLTEIEFGLPALASPSNLPEEEDIVPLDIEDFEPTQAQTNHLETRWDAMSIQIVSDVQTPEPSTPTNQTEPRDLQQEISVADTQLTPEPDISIELETDISIELEPETQDAVELAQTTEAFSENTEIAPSPSVEASTMNTEPVSHLTTQNENDLMSSPKTKNLLPNLEESDLISSVAEFEAISSEASESLSEPELTHESSLAVVLEAEHQPVLESEHQPALESEHQPALESEHQPALESEPELLQSGVQAVFKPEIQPTLEPEILLDMTQDLLPTALPLLKTASWDMVTAASVTKRQIIALGGGGFSQEPENLLLDQYILENARSAREVSVPRVCFVSTAAGDAPSYIERFYTAFKTLDCEPYHLPLFKPEDWEDELEDMILGADVLYFSGGSTKNALALWKAWELEPIFQQAYEAGTVFAGISAGAICWFEQFTTDSVGRSLGAMEGLGWLPGSFTPHYDAERYRKTMLERLLRARKISPGFAADDGAAVHFINSEYAGAISSRPESKAYHVTLGRNRLVESPLETLYLGHKS